MYIKQGYASADKNAGGALMDKSGEWFARAVAINPDRETAYRYWGDALSWQDKRDEARDKFIEAVVAEPYTRTPWVGLSQWADKYGVHLAHLRVDVPKDAAADDPVWGPYAAARAEWRSKRFADTFPGEHAYRHSLAEEAAALRAASAAASKAAWAGKELPPSLANTGGTDHLSFDSIGLPGFQFIQDTIDYDTRTHHSTQDTFERIQPDDMKQAAAIMAAFVYQTAMLDAKLPRKPFKP